MSSGPDSQPQPCFICVAGLTLRIETDRVLEEEARFRPFLTGEQTPDFRITFRQVDELPPIPAEVLYESDCYRVHPDGRGGYLRSFFDAPRDLTPYAVAVYDYPAGQIRIDYLEKGAKCVSEMHNSFFHLGFEALLIHRRRLCLHAACVETPLGGILFSGQSGIGKSTQAELWCRYRGAKQINGDRPILSQGEDGWLAWGSPYAGSSRCHLNESCPVTAIVMLRQAKECSLRRLSPPEAFRAVWSGITMHSWDEAFVEKACDLALELTGAVPVFEFSCTPDEAAVNYLEKGLREWKL
ncbi:MAG: hypothetical protein IJ375_05295 [Oscillospiraceae bacterium]|nr:hypothetical protein [Oscillospiraceae bacterium]